MKEGRKEGTKDTTCVNEMNEAMEKELNCVANE